MILSTSLFKSSINECLVVTITTFIQPSNAQISSYRGCSIKKAVHKNFMKFTLKHMGLKVSALFSIIQSKKEIHHHNHG